MSVTGAANALSTFGVNGVTTLASTLSVTGAATLSNNITVAGNAVFSNAISVANAATFSNTLSVTGAATFANTTGHTGAATFSNTISVTGTSTLTGNATLSGTLQTISGNANFNGGTLFVDAGSGRVGIGTSTPDSVLTVGGPTKVNSTFTVTGTSSFANSVTFANTTTFNQDVTINANLTVTGTRTYVNTQTLDIGDNIITLNADLSGATSPTENAGVEINRGSSANSRLQWNETTDTWQISSASVSTFYNIVNEGTSNTNLDSGTLFVDAVNNRVGINNTAPGVALRVTGAVDISSTANVQGNANVSGLLGVAGGLAVTGTTNTSAQFNVGGGVATTNGATITNTSILLGNSSVNTQISPSQILIRTTATGNSLVSLLSSDAFGGILSLQHGNTTSNCSIVLSAQTDDNASIELGGTFASFIDFKTPFADDFDTRLISNSSGFNIIAGSTTSANIFNINSANVNIDAGALFVDAVNNRVGINNTAPGVALRVTGAVDISSTANIQSNANVGGTLGVANLLTASALNVTNQTNTATLFVTTSANVGTAFTANSTLTNAIALNVVNQTNTATLYVTTSANVGTAAVINATGVYTTGVANAFTHTSGATFTANSTLVNAAAINVVNQTNTGTLYVSTTANIAGLLNAAAGFVVTGIANVSSNLNIGTFGVATNGVNIQNTAIVVGNTSANAKQQWNAFIVANASSQSTLAPTYLISLTVNASANLNVGTFGTTNGVNVVNTTILVGNTTSNAIVSGNLVSVSNTANLTSTTLTIGTTTVTGSQVNSALHTAGLFGVTNGSTINATAIIVGNTTSNAIVSGNLISVSNTANLTSTTLTIGTTTVTTALINTAAINVVNQTNTATLFVTTSANVGTALTISATALTVAPNTNIGSGKLFVDTVNGRVGVNTAAPTVPFDVQGGGGSTFTGRFSTGTTGSPYFSILPNATIGSFNSLVAQGDILLNFSSGTVASGNLVIAPWSGNTGGIKINGLINDIALVGNSFTFTTGNSNFDSGVLFVDAVNNRVGINNTAPGVALRVTGAADISGNANVGGTLGVASLLTASALNVTNQTNTATLFVTTSANVGTALTVNATNINAAANLNMGAYTERLTDLTISAAGTTLLNLQSSSIFRVNVSALTTGVANIRFINPPATGIGVSATLIIQYNTTPVGTFALQGGTSVSNAGSAVKYAYDSAPTLTAATGKSDILSAITYDGGATYIVAPSFMNFTT